MRYVFGPVPSRRLGNSLGVDLLTLKACTFDCVYCQLGRTTERTTERQRFVPPDEAIAEVKQVLASGAAVDYVTLSGSGEPTLSLDLGRVIRAIKKMLANRESGESGESGTLRPHSLDSQDSRFRTSVAVITNGSLLGREDVQADLAEADLVIPSLDAGTQAAFERVNRPVGGLRVEGVARGIRDFTLGFGGQVWLEVLAVAGVNDAPGEAQAIVRLLEGARLDKVQLNTVVRAPAEGWAAPVAEERLRELAAVLEGLAPVEIIGRYAAPNLPQVPEPAGGCNRDRILATLARRPCAAAELAASLGLQAALVARLLEELCHAGTVERVPLGGTTQYRIREP